MQLSDSDESNTNYEGRIEKRSFDNNDNNVNNLLLNENLEIIDKELEDLEYELYANKKIVWFCKKLCQIQPFIILLTSLLGVLGGGIVANFTSYGLLSLIIGGIVGTIVSSTGVIYLMISKSKANKKIPTIKASIEELGRLQEKIKEELKELSKSKKNEINEFISLNNSTKLKEKEIENSINEVYQNTLKPKKLILTKNK